MEQPNGSKLQTIVSKNLETLREMLSELTDSLYAQHRADLEPHKTGLMEERHDVRSALETSAIVICGRIDSIVQDDRNWKPYEETAEWLQIKQNLEAQLRVSQEAVKPRKEFRPVLVRQGRQFLAVYNGVNFQLIGTGETVADALDSFDAGFRQKISEEQWTKEREGMKRLEEAARSQPPTPKKSTKRSKRSGSKSST